jgi:methionine-rich copper-binding protein CopC
MGQKRMFVLAAGAGLLLALAAAWMAGAVPVFAHARYDSSTPGKGEVLATSPARVEITFTQEIQKIGGSYGIDVVKDRGLSVTTGGAVVNDADRMKLSVELQPELAPGRYVVNWRNVSDEDGDPAEGAFSFYVGPYEPNTVDLQNDAQLEQIGAEEDETPATGDTPVSSDDTPTPSDTPSSAPPAGETPAGTPVGAESSDDDDDDGSAAVIAIVVAVVALVVIAAGAGWLAMRRRA